MSQPNRPTDYGIYAEEMDQRRFDEMAQRAGYPDAGNRGGALSALSGVEVEMPSSDKPQTTPTTPELE